jgi:hypothetical protein
MAQKANSARLLWLASLRGSGCVVLATALSAASHLRFTSPSKQRQCLLQDVALGAHAKEGVGKMRMLGAEKVKLGANALTLSLSGVDCLNGGPQVVTLGADINVDGVQRTQLVTAALDVSEQQLAVSGGRRRASVPRPQRGLVDCQPTVLPLKKHPPSS